MKIDIHGHHLPGRRFRHAGVPVHHVHVGVQVRAAPEDLAPPMPTMRIGGSMSELSLTTTETSISTGPPSTAGAARASSC